MPFPLNADELGEKGQRRFQEICADAKLICNQSDRDRTGWDFIVEFPFDASHTTTSLDLREAPLSCQVQVKTLLVTSDRVTLRLSSAERLAKEPKPSFIYIFKVNDALEFIGAYLIHMLAEPLAAVLKRLRKETPSAEDGINKKTISLSVQKYGTSLLPTGAHLRNTLLAICGQNMDTYIAQKSEQLNTLGFGPHRYQLKTTLIFENTTHLVDAFLGLRSNIPATDLVHSETRFGVKKELPMGSTEGLLTISPALVDTCTVTVRADAVSAPAVFRGKVLAPAIRNLPSEHLKFVFDADLFQVQLTRLGTSFITRGDIAPLTPRVWTAYWQLMQVLADGAGIIEIVADTKPIRWPIEIRSRETSLNSKECAHWVRLCQSASAVLACGGVLEEPKVSMAELVENAKCIHEFFTILTPQLPKRPVIFLTEYNEKLATVGQLEVLYANCLSIGSMAMGLYGVGTFTLTHKGHMIEWKCEQLSVKKIMRFNSFPGEYERMLESAKTDVQHQAQWFRTPSGKLNSGADG